ncbi:MAG TPA: hypothetical protein VFY45_25630 [Baekduia sp.]|nr:hypothetical protein [Baekduia sp.]
MSTSEQSSELLRRPYAQRQRIVVVDDPALAAERAVEAESAKTGKGVDWAQMSTSVLKFGAAGAAGILAVEVITAVQKARSEGLKVLTVGRTEAQTLTLPPGHPRDRVIYVGHPAIDSVYYPASGFHRFTFEHKFSEAVRLLMALGATELEVEHVRGWSDDFAANLSMPLPAAAAGSAGVTGGRNHTSGSSALFRAKLTGTTAPSLPEGLVWFPHEPTWQQVAEGRMNYGLREFQLTVRYEDDYGINAGLKVAAQNVGLQLGGNFQEHESTTWKINGTFDA